MSMTNLHAAIGLSQLKRLDKVIKIKEKINRFYNVNIKKIKGLNILSTPKNTISNFWLNILEIDPKIYGVNKKKVIHNLLKNKVNVRSIWYPNHKQKFLKKYQSFEITKAIKKYNTSICLPSGPTLKAYDLKKILSILK